MPQLLRKILKRLGIAAAVLVIIAAIGVGAFRLVIAELPSYQEQVQAWAQDVLGLSVSFARLDARWGLRGPELSFYDASVARPDEATEPMISAAEVTIGLSPIALFFERRFAVDRLILERTRLTLERASDGALRVQGAPFGQQAGRELRFDDLPAVELILSDSVITYTDRMRGLTWEFSDVRVALERTAERVLLEARGTPPGRLGSRIDVSVDGALGPAGQTAVDWAFFAELSQFDIATLAELLPENIALPSAGMGDLSLWFDAVGSEVQRATAQIAVQNLEIGRSAGAEGGRPSYARAAVTAEWVRESDGWQLNLSDLELGRGGEVWPEAVKLGLRVHMAIDTVSSIELTGDFVRLQDLTPLLAALPEHEATQWWQTLVPQGDLTNFNLRLTRVAEGFDYAATAGFQRVGIAPYSEFPGVSGLSGTLRADTRSGRIALSTRAGELDWPSVFRQQLELGELTGIMVWRQGRNGIRLVSDNLILNNSDLRTRSNLELVVPPDGSAPRLELESRVFDFDATRTSHYLPARKLPAPVVAWLDRAIVRGRVPEGEVAFFGPIDAFPFDNGEGQIRARFRVEDGALAYVDGWPVAEDINGEAQFVNAGFSARGTGRLMDNDRSEFSGGVADMRDAVLTVSGDVSAGLGELFEYLRTVPVTARRLGPDLSRLQATDGSGRVSLNLNLPLKNLPAYALDAEIAMSDGRLAVEGFNLAAGDINGRLRLSNNTVTGEGIRATLLGKPVTARVTAATAPGYRALLDVTGVFDAQALRGAFDLPMTAYLSGEANWRGRLHLPANVIDTPQAQRGPLRVEIESDLVGAALELPAPFAKSVEESLDLALDFKLLPANRVDIEGQLGAAQRFALSFGSTDEGLQFRRGSVRLDGSYPLLPPDAGLDVEGNIRELPVDDWLALIRGQNVMSGEEPALSRLDLEVGDLSVFGQQLGATTLAVRQGRDEWLIEVDSAPIAGHLVVPFALEDRPQIIADMQRLHLTMAADGQAREIEPRDLPGLLVNSADFVIGGRSFGRLSADVQADPFGLQLIAYRSVAESFAVDGNGSWLAGPQGSATRFAFSLISQDVATSLSSLGLEPIVDADTLQVMANVTWPGGPSPRWQQGISGDLSLRIEQGSVVNLEPGAGRVWGLLSFTALPRRLALDFRDVFNRGLVFDEVAGDFVLVDGNAYTDNLLLTGPVADIGVVGRTGLRNEDYQQQAVVTAEPGKVLPTMGFLAGPGVGAALLLFTQIFKEPLKGIGRASYCVSGGWDAPVVERLTPEQLQADYLCADLPPSAATAAVP